MEKTKGENLSCPGLQLGQSATERLPQFAGTAISITPVVICEFHGAIGLPGPYYIESRIDGGAAQVTLLVVQGLCIFWAVEQAQEYCLQHVFRVGRVARDSVGCTEDQGVVRTKSLIEFVRNRDCRFLGECGLQVTLPVARLHQSCLHK